MYLKPNIGKANGSSKSIFSGAKVLVLGGGNFRYFCLFFTPKLGNDPI